MFKINVLRFIEKEKTKILKTYLVSSKEELFQDCGIQLSDDEFNKIITEPYLEFDNVGFIGNKLTDEELTRVFIYERSVNDYYTNAQFDGRVNGVKDFESSSVLVELEMNEKQRIEIDYETIIKFNHLDMTIEEFKSLTTQQVREHVIDYVVCSGELIKPDWQIGKIKLI